MRALFALTIILAFSACETIEEGITHVEHDPRDVRLVVGVVVDQMRYDYLTRYAEDYSGGLKRLQQRGFSCQNTHYGYAPTYTGPGHASVYTGTTPAVHGIIGNDWYDRALGKAVYCATDSTVQAVGTESAKGQMSPWRLRSSTLGDEIRLGTNQRGKSIGISLKDRGAILPAGGSADAAYWMVAGDWVTSDWYMDSLPSYVQDFNDATAVEDYIAGGWDLMLDASIYDESQPDNNPYETKATGLDRPTFPYDLESLMADNGGKDIIKATPFGNSITLDFAREVIGQEDLGQDEHLDMLAVSLSSTDYVGHQYGPQSMEAQDTYLRLDQDLDAFIDFLDHEVGIGHYVLFFTADHGAVHVPSYLQNQKIPSGYWNPGNMLDSLNLVLRSEFGTDGLVEHFMNEHFWLDQDILRSNDLESEVVENFIADFCRSFEGVHMTLTGSQLRENEYSQGVASLMQRGHHHRFGSDVAIVTEPGWLKYGRTGTSHGSPYAYDTHVPLIFFGAGIDEGETYEKVFIRDIAPTVAAHVGVQMPSGSTGEVIEDVMGE